jgi:hypothetical protein
MTDSLTDKWKQREEAKEDNSTNEHKSTPMSSQSQSLYQPARSSIDFGHDLENIEESPSDQEMGRYRGQVTGDHGHLP